MASRVIHSLLQYKLKLIFVNMLTRKTEHVWKPLKWTEIREINVAFLLQLILHTVVLIKSLQLVFIITFFFFIRAAKQITSNATYCWRTAKYCQKLPACDLPLEEMHTFRVHLFGLKKTLVRIFSTENFFFSEEQEIQI